MKTIFCPACRSAVPLSVVSDADLQSERGRRNSARRKTCGFGKGRRAVWRQHRPAAWRCRCPECLLRSADKIARDVEARIAAHATAAGAEPGWAEAERRQARKARADLEAAIAERRALWARQAEVETVHGQAA